MKKDVYQFLPNVQKPVRYVGGEYGIKMKAPDQVKLRVALCFPDIYEIGMSHLGSRILYGLFNSLPYCMCERAYAPWPDMEERMRSAHIKLYALESGDDLSDFDILGFTLQYELNYTNVLNMLDLADIGLFARDRGEDDPIIMAGGPCACNCEPAADFFDLVVIGDGEEISVSIAELALERKEKGLTKAEFLRRASELDGVYVPSFYTPKYSEDGTFAGLDAVPGAPSRIDKATVRDLDTMYFPEDGLVPSTDIVFDRAMVELFRGCARGCRFCQAGHIYRPLRRKSKETLTRQAKALLSSTGFGELSLSSLSTSDYSDLNPLCDDLLAFTEPNGISLSLPSLRADSFDDALLSKVQKVRKSGLTFAPEAGTDRLRDVINKNLTMDSLMSACRIAFEGGWNKVKLYFMIGLPTETYEDLDGIADIARQVLHVWREAGSVRSRGVTISVSVSSFVPKPHTPFQWVAQDTVEELQKKQLYLKEKLKIKNVTYSYHDANVSFLEAVLARGDRRLAPVIYDAWRYGCRMDSWDDWFCLDKWLLAMEKNGIDPTFYANRVPGADEPLPWDHIFCGVTRGHLRREYERAYEGKASPDCLHGCAGCGAARLIGGGSCGV